MAKQKSAVAMIRELPWVESVSRNKAGNIVVRRGFYYTNGFTAEKFAERVISGCNKAGLNVTIVGSGEVWKPFKGGASVANNSHWWVELTVEKEKQ